VVDFSVQPNWPTTTKLRLLSANQQLVRMDFEAPTTVLDCNALMQACIEHMPQADLLVLSDYHKGALINPQCLIQAAKRHHLYVIVDPKQLDFRVYHGASLITPNFKEFTAVVGECPNEQILIEKGFNLLQQHALGALLITRGEEGMSLIDAEGQHFHWSAKAPEVFDVTGAGDTVVATLSAALASGESLHHAVRLANTAAGIVVGRLGVASVSPLELEHAVVSEDNLVRIDLSPDPDLSISHLIATCQAQRQTLAIIIGAFDTVRLKHINEIAAIKSRFDRIIVGILSADLLPDDPIQPLQARLMVMRGLADIDWVIPVLDQNNLESISHLSSEHIFYV
jgi:D-beta-D-heptose 7-phosphate kinase / D-beta-D-heptose 1-phosphate adenosyltransferase